MLIVLHPFSGFIEIAFLVVLCNILYLILLNNFCQIEVGIPKHLRRRDTN